MSFYDDPNKVEEYIQMAAGYDGRVLIDRLHQHLPSGSTVLELGMGPGVDLNLLQQFYTATGSDKSNIFLERYRQTHPQADLLLLDAVTLNTSRTFDCIYSNKVLHHLMHDELRTSFQRQASLLNERGLLCHSFWYGDKEEVMMGLRFVYHTETTLPQLWGEAYQVVMMQRYAEMDADDSLLVILQKRLDTD